MDKTYTFILKHFLPLLLCLNVLSLSAQYCTPSGSGGNGVFFGEVCFPTSSNPFNNCNQTNVGSNYGNFTNLGSRATYSDATPNDNKILMGIDNDGVTPYYYSVYVDLNHNQNFTDPGEAVKDNICVMPTSGAQGRTGHNVTLSIPATATSGDTRIRLIAKRGSMITGPCETGFNGEPEDYIVTLNIVGGGGGCNDPTVPLLSATNNPICPGGNTTINVSGTLNDATQWVLYSGGCGSNQVATSTTGSFNVSPNSNTTYHVRGEGGCVTPGSCGSISITASDTQKPNISCPSNINKAMSTGQCGATASWSAATASDNCTANPTVIQTMGSSSGSFFNEGTHTIKYTATDGAGNSKDCTFTVTVQSDGEKPSISCPSNITKAMDMGQCTAVASWSTPVATDNCDPNPTETQTMGSASGSAFPEGTHTIEYTATDANSNSETCTFTVTVQPDSEKPSISCPSNINQAMDAGQCTYVASWSTPVATDNCDSNPTETQTMGSASGSAFPEGTHTIEYTATDANSNSETCTFTVTVQPDSEKPSISCPSNINQAMDAGQCTYVASWSTPVATDNCDSNPTETQTMGSASGSAFPEGTHTIEYTATDANNNSETCTFTVTVQPDAEKPTVVCKSHTTLLNASGNATITVNDLVMSSGDNCTTPTLSIKTGATSYDCNDEGQTFLIVVEADDGNGNTETCNSNVTVEDAIDPVVTCKDITVQLDGNGNVTITGTQVYNSTSDNCAIATLSVSPNTFGCGNLGANSVTLTATDYGGNTDDCSATVTVEDNTAPSAQCKSAIVQLDNTGNGTLTVNDVNDNSTDNCAITSSSINLTNFSCSDIGTHTVTLSLSDGNGNNSSCNSTVSVQDNIKPDAQCKDITITCGGGQVTIMPGDVDDGSSDNCSFSLSLDQTLVSCTTSPVTVTLTATDGSGNTNDCTSTINFNIQGGTVSLAISDVSKMEGNWWGFTYYNFTVTRSGGTNATSVQYATADGSATVAGLDYIAKSGTLTWAAGGSDVQNILIQVRKDNNFEPDENFTVNLSNPTGGATISDGVGDGTILNDDAAPLVIYDDQMMNQLNYGQQHLARKNIILVPNPVKDDLQIFIPNNLIIDGTLNASLFDNSGRKISTHSFSHDQNRLDVGSLRNGIYYVVFMKPDGTMVSERFVKMD